MSDELKPCPFCGNQPTRATTVDWTDRKVYLICCDHCETINDFTLDQQKGIDEWNTRPIESELRAKLAILEKALAEAQRNCNLPRIVSRICREAFEQVGD